MTRLATILACLAFAAWTCAAAGADFSSPATAKDGDDLIIAGHDLRMFGIDAPELSQRCEAGGSVYPCGEWARDALAGKVAGARVDCDQQDYDARNGRPVVTCRIGSQDLNAWLVDQGWAVAYRHYSIAYVAKEEAAKAQRRGLWRGAFVMPWDWRRGSRLPQEATAADPVPLTSPTNCVIKGNISSSGERIYHMPGQQHYAATKITESKGEHWFCSEAEAQAAGWRKSKR
jgi:endonuclease YncB( thermonuclease family)